MSDEQDGVVQDCRQRFTEESTENSLEREVTQDDEELTAELQRLHESSIQPGRVSMSMLEDFRNFPYAQNVVMTVARLDDVLMEFLEVYANIKPSTTKQWQRQNVLHYRALLSLAVYESFTTEETRGDMEEFIQQYEEKYEGVKNGDQDDPLGNTLVESARKLSGTGKSKKPKKPKKAKALTPSNTQQQKAKTLAQTTKEDQIRQRSGASEKRRQARQR